METYNWKDLLKVEAVLKGEFGEVWLFDTTPGDYQYKCYSEDRPLMAQIKSWDGARQGASYSRSDGVLITYDVIIPKRLVKRACKILGIKFVKDQSKVADGRFGLSNLISFKKKGSG